MHSNTGLLVCSGVNAAGRRVSLISTAVLMPHNPSLTHDVAADGLVPEAGDDAVEPLHVTVALM